MVAMTAGATLAQEEAAPPAPAAKAVVEFGTGLDYETRDLIEPGAVFAPEIGQVWCLTRIDGLEAPASVTHVWYHGGETRARVDLPVNSASWRTWSSKRILPSWTGRWEVKVLDAEGTVLGASAFEIH